ncbi:MAG: hypothetical protein MPEBLZ_02897 [Candidatus Methanoperedens nitroreducens]|uniref:Uncharacterized protein n=1 Tax=Candidatus Methanoperedens nitratireducens TaxID=1392998 RepID=A0A0P8CIA7_9EURY|nr:hypothetical protein [Candidatus Methanoperedens sp. BLZ2]KAB2945771.1 MAG: hypothetical protein F9K14_09875 [Candidatus Methanoperedens sp.]KPQ42551.1 MAG: hypothetical protein MPEBLZ_02897 [Candidatus Methanoperedens sp. BLZ1]MBZ0174271.1 hypothetical protein [Candidatus Methanoperedens nitroreducens]MCX9077322.1 hypothetical protein [Candidatus Methanoperedens sp.]
MGGPIFSVEVYFKESSNPTEALAFLVKKIFKNYFIPQSVYFQYKENGFSSKHYFGIDKSLLKREVLLHQEKELEPIRFTKLDNLGCEKEFLEILSKKTILDYGFSAFGSLKTYYQQDSNLMADFFFREKQENAYIPILNVNGHYMNISEYVTDKTYEHQISFEFIGSSILLDDRWGINNKIASEKNFEIIINKTKELIDKFKNVYDYSYCMIEGRGYYDKFDVIRDKFSILPNFKGFNWM